MEELVKKITDAPPLRPSDDDDEEEGDVNVGAATGNVKQ
jgi:hypothetical protein